MNQEEYCRALYDFKADGHNELSVSKGEVVKLISAHGEWMMVEKVSKPFQKGFVPTLYISIIKNSSSDNSKTNSLTSSINHEATREEKRKSKQQHPTSSTSINNNNNISANIVTTIPSTTSSTGNNTNSSTQNNNNYNHRNDRVAVAATDQLPNHSPSPPLKQQQQQRPPPPANNTQKPIPNQPSPSPHSSTIAHSSQLNTTAKSIITTREEVLPVKSNTTTQHVVDDPNLSKLSVVVDNTRKQSSTITPHKGSGVQKPILSGFVTKVVVDYEDSVALMQSYETNEKIFKQSLAQREEAFKNIEQKLDKISKDVLDFQTTNDQLIDKIRRLELRIENDRSNLINNYSTDLSSLPETSERKRNTTSRNFQGSTSKN